MRKSQYQYKVDEVVKQFWKYGFMTLSRKFGTYLPTPKRIGEYEVDAVGKYKSKYAIGIVLKEEELNDPKLLSKLQFLASRFGDNANRKVLLFVGVADELNNKARILISTLPDNIKRKIRIVSIPSERVN
ncbi:MAG: hypothetical protein K9J16_07290 [Melioribacteraceae bacterium]|nr:hypothetical protein [Melioribacteraceae bacterium]MCF8354931.1 hypothetical protein [Melioribacteraceae bacterium]MCF8392380.1 hypothetical protein [Melioribacteraceae bacterium]MCF8417900.1 hypothetical protein [Melioribacteraceae bacterium]